MKWALHLYLIQLLKLICNNFIEYDKVLVPIGILYKDERFLIYFATVVTN